MVLHRWANAESGVGSQIPCLTVVWFDMGFNCSSKGSKRFFHVVVVAVEVCECGYLWDHLGLLEEIQGEFCWFEEVAPDGERELVIDAR